MHAWARLLEHFEHTIEACPRLRAGRYQRQVGQARLLGEAYNYRLLPSRVVLDTLHLLLAAGHADAEQAARLDPPGSYFRIRCRVVSRAHADFRLLVLLLCFQRTPVHRARRPRSIRSEMATQSSACKTACQCS